METIMEKNFSINECGCSIRCKIYQNQPRNLNWVVVYGHGFGGHKDNRAAEKFAGKFLSKHKDAAVLTFDLPCHGDDGRKKLLLEDCDLYIRLVTEYARKELQAERISVYATSFGGYLFLKYIHDHGNPFDRIALRCPAIPMDQVIRKNMISEEDEEKLEKGKPVLIGFDRKVKIDQAFLDSLEKADLSKLDFTDFADDILILHGTKDEVVPFDSVQSFADENVIEMIPVENADHRFQDPKRMDLAISEIIQFLEK